MVVLLHRARRFLLRRSRMFIARETQLHIALRRSAMWELPGPINIVLLRSKETLCSYGAKKTLCSYEAKTRLSGGLVQAFDDDLFRVGTDDAIDDGPVLEDQHGRDARDLVTRRRRGILVDV